MKQYMIYRRDQDVVWDRAIGIWGEEVRIRTGRAGEVTHLDRVTRNNCLQNDPWQEMQWRCVQWVGDGYTLIGYGSCQDGRLRLIHQAEPVPPQAQPKDDRLALHWRTTRSFEPDELEPVLRGIASKLGSAGVTATAHEMLVDGRCDLSVETPNRHWMIRLQPNGVLTEVGRDSAPVRPESGRLLVADGTVPVLALMRIERAFPGAVRFVWVEQTDAWTVEPKLEAGDPCLGSAAGQFGETVRIATELGLRPRVQVVVDGLDSGTAPLWF